ncbi:hypothetical protein [Streptomyces albicerus]|uniref:hypothetical protein n=1 Tax=Streptomyces albicerus TaxID=2569859 RepID=UPI001788E532|nr:hypothetical protein [Streptomyces albicerus]
MSEPVDTDPTPSAAELLRRAAADYAAAQASHEKQDHRDDVHPITPAEAGGAS